MNNSHGAELVTSRWVGWVGRCKGKAVAPEDVVNYLKGAQRRLCSEIGLPEG